MKQQYVWLAATASLLVCEAAPYSLFSFDDHTIPFRHNLYLTLNQPTKYSGNPVVPRGAAGSPDAMRAQFYGSVIRVGPKWRMWYAAMAHEGAVGSRTTGFHIAYAESDDGLRWRKPNLGLTDFNGNTNNNLVGLSPKLDYELVEPLASFVLHEPDDPDPARRYKMTMYGRYYDRSDTEHRRAHATIYPYFSADGLRWTLARPAPKAGAFNDSEAPFATRHVFEMGGLYKFNGLYHVVGQEIWQDVWMPGGAPSGRMMVVHWSGDFIQWSQDKVFAFQRWGYRSVRENMEEAHEPAGVWNRGNLSLATYGLWHGATRPTERRMDLGFLVSNDGLHFREPVADHVFIPAGKDGEWDRRGLIHGQGYENVNDKTYIYYGTWNLSSEREDGGAVGVAMLPRDRFGFLATRLNGMGQFTTIPIPARRDPRTLRLNVDGVGPKAALRIELIDTAGKPLDGFSGGDAAVIRDSGFVAKVNWPRGGAIASDYRLRVRFEGEDSGRIRFYAAYLDE